MPHSPLATPRATIDVLEAHGLRLRASLGQNFLVDDNIVGRILALAALSGDESVLEVGPGIGTLTLALCRVAGAVVSVERDERFARVLADTAEECDNLSVVMGDAVNVPSHELRTRLGPPTDFVANLPYGVAATVILRYFQEIDSLETAVVMVQAEVADRISAVPGTKDYGSYTVKLKLQADVAGRFAVSRTCFLPPPRVDSAVVRLERRVHSESPEVVAAASRMADAAFAQRRKTLRNSVRAVLAADADHIESVLAASGIDGSRRAETLSVEEYVFLGRNALELGLLP
ncbi:MAG: 16S rRNA (adenine(1518)-N(6)/adenine(1519)-N(6))-dimethyltransferase RsmA [Actinomycetota bacterium]|nr:16S rRNA (adenine(1518)-N(6)/adenine(1519)-N(6))-dimethyltransferase RsmA [Actinomycetota bacterium]